MVMTSTEIMSAMQGGAVVISPFEPELLNNCSYDIRLGDHFARLVQAKDQPRLEWEITQIEGKLRLEPGQRVLGHTQQFIGGTKFPKHPLFAVVAELRATSTAARLGLSICQCAGWGDVGYVNRWTLELQNHSAFPMHIPIGARIGQIVFHVTGNIPDDELYSRKGQYQGTSDLEQLKKEWKPEDMLPKGFKV